MGIGIAGRSSNTPVVDAVRRAMALEYALNEACYSDAESAWEIERAFLGARAQMTQTHMFDLGLALKEQGEEPMSYSKCVRHSLLQSGDHHSVLARLDREYLRLLERGDVPQGLRVLIRTNLAEHRGLNIHELSLTPSTRAA